MIISRTPFRLSLGGGGTDLPSYYAKYGGFFVSGAVNRYVYITVNKRFEEDSLRVSYSTTEIVPSADDVQHRVVREALKLTGIHRGIEIVSVADAPAAAGLGSSGSFCVGLLTALHSHLHHDVTRRYIAEEACDIAMNRLHEPSGKQDEYVATYGGINAYEVDKEGNVTVSPLSLSLHTLAELEANTLVFYTGIKRDASQILSKQQHAIEKDGAAEKMHTIKEIGFKSRDALASGDLTKFGELLHEHWVTKRGVIDEMSSDSIDRWYGIARENGALGGKVCFAPGIMVSTDKGYRAIEEIEPGDKVYDHRNELQYVHRAIRKQYQGPMLELTVTGLLRRIVVTPEHPLMTTVKDPRKRREKRKIINLPVFKAAKEFRQGQVLLLPVDETVEDFDYVDYPKLMVTPKYSNHDLYEGLPSKVPVNREFLNLIGWYTAEGSRSHKQVFFTLNSRERPIAEQLLGDISTTFSKTAVIAPQWGSANSIVVRCPSVAISQLMADLCGHDAQTKHLPEFVMKLPRDKQFVVLRALWQGDGTLQRPYDRRTGRRYTRCAYKTTSFVLAKQVQRICWRLGFICHMRSETSPAKRIYRNRTESRPHTVYILDVTGDDGVAFHESVSTGRLVPVVRRNHKKLSLRKEFCIIEGVTYAKASIRAIGKSDYDGEVYNLEVEGNHTYVAGDVAVHNCGAGGGGFLMLYCDNGREKLREAMAHEGLVEHRFRFDFEGSKVIYNV